MKILHIAGSIGLMGGLAAFMMLLGTGPETSAVAEYAAMRQGLETISRWLIVPSLVATLVSGVLAMAVHFPFQNMGWVWIKAGSGLLAFEASLATIDGPARAAAHASRRALAGEIDGATLASMVDDKWGAWWVLMAIFVLNVVLGVFRPRFSRPARAQN
jgi:uncharacterized membrane protein